MIDAFGASGLVADQRLDLAVHGTAALVTAYLRVSDRAGIVVLGGGLRWLGPAAGDRQFYRIAEMMRAARYDSFVTPDLGRIPRTALPPGTLVVMFSPLLDPRGFGALTDLRQRGFPLIVVDTLRDEPPGQIRGRPTKASRCGCGGWTARRPAPPWATSASRCSAGRDRHRTRQRAGPAPPAARAGRSSPPGGAIDEPRPVPRPLLSSPACEGDSPASAARDHESPLE